MVRPAVMSDFDAILRMASAFAEASKGGFEVKRLVAVLHHCMLHELLLVHENLNGFLAANSYNWMLDPSKKIGCELAWWVDPEHRGKGYALELLEGYIKWGKEKGFDHLEISCLEHLDKDDLGRLYQRVGFKPTQRTFRMDLGA